MFLIAYIFLALFVNFSWEYGGGAPLSACDSMTPKHPGKPQTSKHPYKVTMTPGTVKRGGIVEIVITGKDSFKGFLVEVRDKHNKAVGEFEFSTHDEGIMKTLNCHSNKNSAVTHTKSKPKSEVVLKWRSPIDPGKYKLCVTYVKTKYEYWVSKGLLEIQVN